MHRFNNVLFGGTGNSTHVIQMIEPTSATCVRPVKPDEFDSRRDHLVSMAIQSSMDKDISGCGPYPAVVSGFLEASRQHNRCIGV